MTFDRFMKEFLAEEFKDFPNTVYKNDCWYSFTPQGLMQQIFVLRDKHGVASLYYDSFPLIAPTGPIAGNSMKKCILGRPRYMAAAEYMKLHPENNEAAYGFRVSTVAKENKANILHAMLSEVIKPYFKAVRTVQELQQYCQKCVEDYKKTPHLYLGKLDLTPYAGTWLFTRSEKQYPCVYSYLEKPQDGIEEIKRQRASHIAIAQCSYQIHKSNIPEKADAIYQNVVKIYGSINKDYEQFLLLPIVEQRKQLRTNFEDNRVKIRDLLKIEPEFDMDFIFPEK